MHGGSVQASAPAGGCDEPQAYSLVGMNTQMKRCELGESVELRRGARGQHSGQRSGGRL